MKMRIWKPLLIAGVVSQALMLSGCNTYHVVPPHLENRVNEKLSYQEAKKNPTSATGQMVVWGGEVLKSTRMTDKTRIEVLQLPLTDDLIPAGERAESSGRFMAFDTKGKSSTRRSSPRTPA